MILFRICSNLQVIHAVNQLCIPGWIACYTLTIPGQTLANMKQTFYWIETLVVSQSLHAGIPACSSIISDDTWYRIGSMINCLTLTCVVTIRIVDKEIYKQGKRDQSWKIFKRSVRKIFKLLHRQDVTRRHVVAPNISLTGSQTVDKISAVMSIRA